MQGQSKTSPKAWLAFDLNVLKRLTFSSVAIPISEQVALPAYLKLWKVRVSANHPLRSFYTALLARIGNADRTLSPSDLDTVLEDAYVPGYRLANPALGTWFNETDAWWFDNVRRNIEKLEDPMKRAIAAAIALTTGDHVLSFDQETRELRQPLSNVYRRLHSLVPDPYDNGHSNGCDNRNVDDFIAETPSDLMFLRLPQAHAQSERAHRGQAAWREEWLRGEQDFWGDVEAALHGRLGSSTETKSQYLHLLEETLRRATHIKKWAIAHVEDGFIQTQDVADAVARIRRVETVYTKDFSELTGTRAVIIVA